jgi:DNA repair protein RadC
LSTPSAGDGEPKPHYLGHRERLREKLVKRGVGALDDYELVETLLFAFIPRRDVKPIAKALLTRFGSLSALLSADARTLQQTDGVGETAAAYLRAVGEIQVRAAREAIAKRSVLSSWAALLTYLRVQMQHQSREQFRVIFLDRKNQILTDEMLGEGTVDQAPVYPREIARRALEHAASAVILVHNHPSGDPTPSRADIDMTREIIDALTPLEISVHDHLIVGRDGTTSLKSKGLI